jgi:arsenical pump membrane protein
MSAVLVWSIAAGMIAGILFRPKDWPEAVWACLGATLLVLCGLLSPQAAGQGIGKGSDVYLFLAGMMLLAELARREGVFDWLASHAVKAANGSRARLFTIVYAAGILVTVLLSNDATAVVLTPAVYAAVRRARTEALPYLFSCAFVANAASFVLPISNPANLVVYGSQIPPLIPWLKLFLAPSALSIAATFLVLRLLSNGQLRGCLPENVEGSTLTAEGRRAVWGLAIAGGTLVSASAFGLGLGLPTCAAAVAAVLIASGMKSEVIIDVAGSVSWSVLPLVAGLFVLVEALDRVGALHGFAFAIRNLAGLRPVPGSLSVAFGVALLSNLMNNLPSGLLAGSVLHVVQVPEYVKHAILIGTDLGPNLSVSGSLATVLWLIALRREGTNVDAWTFLKIGALVMPAALIVATTAMVLMGT